MLTLNHPLRSISRCVELEKKEVYQVGISTGLGILLGLGLSHLSVFLALMLALVWILAGLVGLCLHAFDDAKEKVMGHSPPPRAFNEYGFPVAPPMPPPPMRSPKRRNDES